VINIQRISLISLDHN